MDVTSWPLPGAPREARQDELAVKPVRAPAMGAYVQMWGLKGCSLTEQIQSFTERHVSSPIP